MNHINGIGGAFIFSENPKALADWYTEYLGLDFEGSEEFGAFYQMFWSLDPEDPSRKRDTTFSIIKAKTSFKRDVPETEPDSMYGDQPFMVNLRTDDLENLLADLEAKGVRILKREFESYGKFAWIRDLDGNRVELYQPIPQTQAES